MSATLVKAPIEAPSVGLHGDWQKIEAAYITDLAEWARSASPHRLDEDKLIGEVIRWQRADGYASYMVLTTHPLRLMHLDLGDGYTVEASLLRGLTLADVRGMVARDRSWERVVSDSNAIYEHLKPGDIVHYRESTAAFVRCEVVAVPKDWKSPAGSDGLGGVALKPIALVGEVGRRQEPDGRWIHGWAEYDMPRYNPDGTVRTSYHVDQVLEGRLFQPNGANLYESPRYGYKDGLDPRGLKPIDLSPPAKTDEQRAIEPFARKMNRIRELVEMRWETEESVRSLLDMIHDTSEVE